MIIEHFFTIDIDNCVGKMIYDAVNPITYDIINILINVTDSLTLNPNLYNKTDVEKIKYGNIKRKLIEELKIDLNKLIEALKIYMEEFVEKINTPYYSEQIKNLNDINLLTFCLQIHIQTFIKMLIQYIMFMDHQKIIILYQVQVVKILKIQIMFTFKSIFKEFRRKQVLFIKNGLEKRKNHIQIEKFMCI